MAEYYNISQAKRIYVRRSEISPNWFHYPPRIIKGIINYLIHYNLYNLNKKGDVYRQNRYFGRNETIPYYTKDTIITHLKDGEYVDVETNEIRILPKVVLEWQNNDKTEIFFNDDKSAKEYMDAIIGKYGSSFIKLGND